MYKESSRFLASRITTVYALFSCFKDLQEALKKASNAIVLGGYLEMQDIWVKLHLHDGIVVGTNLEDWYETFYKATVKFGRDFECGLKYKQWVQD